MFDYLQLYLCEKTIPPNPYSMEYSKCGIEKKGYLCDPDYVLPKPARQSLHELLLYYPRDTPCLCRQTCFRNEINQNARLVFSVLILKNFSNENNSIAQYAESVRKNWKIGLCNGNDVLVLIANSYFHISYGPIIARSLSPDCSKRLILRYDPKKEIINNIRQIAFILREFFLDPCLCRPCKTAYSWFKIPAMLLACFCLLTWLSLIGRRAYLRRNHLLNSRPYCSISDLTYAVRIGRSNRSHRSHSSIRSDQIRNGLNTQLFLWNHPRIYNSNNHRNNQNENLNYNLNSQWLNASLTESNRYSSNHFVAPPPAYSSLKFMNELPPPSYSEIKSNNLCKTEITSNSLRELITNNDIDNQSNNINIDNNSNNENNNNNDNNNNNSNDNEHPHIAITDQTNNNNNNNSIEINPIISDCELYIQTSPPSYSEIISANTNPT